ncbi:type VI secretion system baseplate subunit TssF [Paraburkholderia sp.]|uniref:type VI secretion system baseplate subunit TssF n=1 Tax=Paraburkholderia sp. TaxID=1926495 RepID=UPI0023850714|nr:type VI secretion system baseplate subunit TssF [Paraburkholderia sp.]MDE1183231.1 type VI secretion system baseplate subunit TssF [Paraburkholderia sp.]
MDTRLLDYYNRELAYLRESGAEFATEFPNVAGELGMRGSEIDDPYVERLLEGFSFLTARIHLKMDAEFPRFSQRMLDMVYPNYGAPLPSMAIVAITPNLREGSLLAGHTLAAGTSLRANLTPGEQTSCEFRTAHEVTLWPLRIVDVKLTGEPSELPLSRLVGTQVAAQVRSALTIRIEATGVQTLGELSIDRLAFHLSAPEAQALPLLELMVGHSLGVICHPAPDADGPCTPLDDAIRHEGFNTTQSLLPYGTRSFQGYRLLHEYFAFPARYLFVSIGDLQRALPAIRGTAFTLTILLDKAAPELERPIGQHSLALFCTPAVNLFPKQTDRVAVLPSHHEQHIVVDRTRPLDYEIYGIESVTGHLASDGKSCPFEPFYRTHSETSDSAGHHGRYFTMRREPRLVANRAQANRNGARSMYNGTEAYVSLVDQREAPFSDDLRHLSAHALCTNRDLGALIPLGGGSDFSLRVSAPVASINVLRGPTPPRAALAENETTWRLISHLGLNYLTLTDLDDTQGAHALRSLLELYAGAADPTVLPQIHGVRQVRVEPVHRALPHPGPLMFGRGVNVSLLLDELAFAGASTYLFGAVMDQFFARHVSMNSFSELSVATLQRGEVKRWPPRIGRRPTA